MKTINWDDAYSSGRDYVYLSRQEIDKILSYLQKDLTNAKALDLGCGTGQLTRELYHQGFNKVVGIDGSEEAISLAKAATIFPVEYIVGDIEQDFTSTITDTFELIICKDTFAFIGNKNLLLRRIKDLLTENGLFVLVSPLRSEFSDRPHITVDTDETKSLLQNNFDFIDYFTINKEEFYILKKLT
ncbi:hypothetical protein A3F64_01635 [Candidatus Saccharibacteria bacterium RIFCSPHIGHO2_12_FULL_42_8]|nr:MAG: hypothetical protein A3F64_01635 [Candidatus Saccharibacteria bacterium RIFCSPHIGHO2_12_FULL_42_8]